LIPAIETVFHWRHTRPQVLLSGQCMFQTQTARIDTRRFIALRDSIMFN
jgi:hypothetical protein